MSEYRRKPALPYVDAKKALKLARAGRGDEVRAVVARGDVPAALTELANLEGLELRETAEVPAFVFELVQLRELALFKAPLPALPIAVADLARLERLDLVGCGTRSFSPALARLTELRILHLGNNDLDQVPPEVGALTKLEELHLWKIASASCRRRSRNCPRWWCSTPTATSWRTFASDVEAFRRCAS